MSAKFNLTVENLIARDLLGITAVPDMGAIAEHLEAEGAAAENAETDADHAQDYAEEPELPTAPRRRGRRSELGATLN